MSYEPTSDRTSDLPPKTNNLTFDVEFLGSSASAMFAMSIVPCMDSRMPFAFAPDVDLQIIPVGTKSTCLDVNDLAA